MFKAPISLILFTLVGVSCTTAQIPIADSTPDIVYLAAVREFARTIVATPDESTPPFFLQDSVDDGGSLGFLNDCLQDTGTFTVAERAQIGRWAGHPAFRA
jgi:hypothetical protein